MKILITGTSSGFGKFLLDHYSTYCDVVSINRPEFDLKTSEFLDRIDDSVDYDIVIINAATRSTRETEIGQLCLMLILHTKFN